MWVGPITSNAVRQFDVTVLVVAVLFLHSLIFLMDLE